MISVADVSHNLARRQQSMFFCVVREVGRSEEIEWGFPSMCFTFFVLLLLKDWRQLLSRWYSSIFSLLSSMMTTTTTSTTIDYETTVFTLKSDHLGPNRATLVHARTPKVEQYFYKAILYLHGYGDYYFQWVSHDSRPSLITCLFCSDHLCQQFLNHGYDFFALDLRKCGRSIISPDQDAYKHYFCDISEYDEEITLSIEHMTNQARAREKKFILFGHSTGNDCVSRTEKSAGRDYRRSSG